MLNYYVKGKYISKFKTNKKVLLCLDKNSKKYKQLFASKNVKVVFSGNKYFKVLNLLVK